MVSEFHIKISAVILIGLIWYEFTKGCCKTAWLIISTPTILIEKIFFNITMSDNKLVKTIMDAATLTGLAAGIGWIAKKVVKENFTADPSSNVMNFAKFTAVMSGSIALKQYLQDQKILPDEK